MKKRTTQHTVIQSHTVKNHGIWIAWYGGGGCNGITTAAGPNVSSNCGSGCFSLDVSIRLATERSCSGVTVEEASLNAFRTLLAICKSHTQQIMRRIQKPGTLKLMLFISLKITKQNVIETARFGTIATNSLKKDISFLVLIAKTLAEKAAERWKHRENEDKTEIN